MSAPVQNPDNGRSECSSVCADDLSAQSAPRLDVVHILTTSSSLLAQSNTAHDPEPRHPIHQLPTELLVLVFTYAVAPNSRSLLLRTAYAIGSTCRQWRDIALHTPELWRIVDCTIRPHNLNGWQDWDSFVRRGLRPHIERASSLPLDVYITLHVKPQYIFWLKLTILFMRARSSHLTVTVNIYDKLRIVVFGREAPHLTHFAFNDGDYRIVEGLVEIGRSRTLSLPLAAPRLQSIECVGGPVHMTRGPYPNVRKVTFRNERRPSIFTEASFTDILRSTPNVVELDVSWYELESPYSQPVETLALADLESLTLAVSDAFFPLDTARSFSFPSLCKASIKSRSSDDDGAAVDDSRAQAVTAFIRTGLHTVRELELDFGRDLSPAIVEGLELCDHLEFLTLHAYPGVGVIKGLSIPRADGTWLCPQLHTIVLHIHPDTLGDETVGFGEAVIDLAAARRAGLSGSVLKRAEIQATESNANLDMLTDLQARVVRILS